MNNKINNAFDSIHAEDELKLNTENYINSKRKKALFSYKKFVPALAAFVFVLISCFFGHKLYITEAAVISVDVNPSVELGINTFNKVISVTGYNDDGIELAQNIDVKNMNYKEAVQKILEMDFSEDAVFSVTVAGKNGKVRENCLSDLKSVSVEDKVYVDSATNEEVREAHQKGLSFGKYKAYLELYEYDKEITEEKIKDMTMRDIRDKIKGFEKDKNSHTDKNDSQCDNSSFYEDSSKPNVNRPGKEEDNNENFHGGKEENDGFHGGRNE